MGNGDGNGSGGGIGREVEAGDAHGKDRGGKGRVVFGLLKGWFAVGWEVGGLGGGWRIVGECHMSGRIRGRGFRRGVDNAVVGIALHWIAIVVESTFFGVVGEEILKEKGFGGLILAAGAFLASAVG